MKSFYLFSFFLLFSFQTAAAETLRVGMELSYPPFEMTDKSGEPSGVSVDLAKALADSLARPLKIVNMSFDGLIPALKTGAIDVVISSLTVNEERKKSIDFSEPYVSTGLALIVSKNSKIQNAADLDKEGISVAVKKGTTGHSWALNNLKKAKLLVFDKESAAIVEVLQAKSDAFIYDQLSVYQNWQKHKDKLRAILKPFQAESWAVGVKKGNQQMIQSVNKFLKEFKSKKGFDTLATKYFGEEKKVFQELGVEFLL
ncbi:MAG: transporter substrate-binding domain-containing protein [Proteobacteria bacterium]|nr:transporter substrate-binding domain-containing protein [Pseudomonadota bacterium]